MLFEIITIILSAHWSLVSFYVLLGLLGYFNYMPRMSPQKAKNVELCIVTKASLSVRDALFECIRHNATKFSDYRINMIVDDKSELNGNLERYVKQFSNVRMIVVPDGFKCKAIAKGRAQEYFRRNFAEDDKWYVFFDDDNLIMDDRFLHEIPHYEAKGCSIFNGVLYPRRSGSIVTHIADYLRYFDDLTVFRFSTGLLGRPLNGLHGELLGIHGYVLKRVGFDRHTVTEDFAFGREAYRLGFRTWQSATAVSILSPYTVRDFFKQRKRWFKGNIRDALTAPLPMKAFVLSKLLDWKVGILGSWATLPIWIFMHAPWPVVLFSSIGMLYYLTAYFYGAMKQRSWKDKMMFLAFPLYSIIENLAPHYKNGKGFEVIRKSRAS